MVKAALTISVELDREDLRWLTRQAFPFGLSPEGMLRMWVRRGRLGLAEPIKGMNADRASVVKQEAAGKGERWRRAERLVRSGADADPPSGQGQELAEEDVEAFVSDQLSVAEADGAVAAGPSPLAQAGGAVVIGPRIQRPAIGWARRG